MLMVQEGVEQDEGDADRGIVDSGPQDCKTARQTRTQYNVYKFCVNSAWFLICVVTNT